MKFYEIPLSPITESCHQILFQVAIAVLEPCSSTVPLHTKTSLWRMSGCEGIIPLKQEYTGSKTGAEALQSIFIKVTGEPVQKRE